MTSNRSLAGRLGAAAASPAPARTATPAAASGISSATTKFTLLLDGADGAAFDELHLRVRRAAGAAVRKSDIVRTLLAIATEDGTLREQLIQRIGDAATA